MATALADSPASEADSHAVASGSPAGAPPQLGADGSPPAGRTCAKCGMPMDPAQGWCLHCGAAAPGSLGSRTPSWRSAATVLGATALLVLGAAAAAYAALTESGSSRPATPTVAQAPPAAAPAPTPPPAAPATKAPKAPGKPTTIKPARPLATVKPPKIPLTTQAPKRTSVPTTPSATTPPTPAPKKTSPPAERGEPQPSSIELDTNSASTYDPSHFPASDFGDPSLAIDGDRTTGWTAKVEPSGAPNLAAGLLVDLKGAQRLSAVELITSTPGMTVQVFGANGSAAPATMTDPAWVALSSSLVASKRHVHIGLRDSSRAFRFVTLWISKAPPSSTPEAPGLVSVNELELFPAR
jgi:hypothetical protein